MVITARKWVEAERRQLLDSGINQSTMAHVPFLREYSNTIVVKGHWVVMPYSVDKELTV